LWFVGTTSSVGPIPLVVDPFSTNPGSVFAHHTIELVVFCLRVHGCEMSSKFNTLCLRFVFVTEWLISVVNEARVLQGVVDPIGIVINTTVS